MAKEKEKDEVIIDVEEAYSKTEKYIEDNKNSLSVIAAAIVVIVGGYFAYTRLYLAPLEKEAQEQMWKAEQYFETDSFDLAINGDGNYLGFLQIAEDYSATYAGNIANYYLGIAYLRKGDFSSAIEYLSIFDASDEMVGPISVGAIGDCHMELGNAEEAISYYLSAADKAENSFTSPIYLMKAGLAYEQLNDYESAFKVFERIKNDHPESEEGRSIDKYLARAGSYVTH